MDPWALQLSVPGLKYHIRGQTINTPAFLFPPSSRGFFFGSAFMGSSPHATNDTVGATLQAAGLQSQLLFSQEKISSRACSLYICVRKHTYFTCHTTYSISSPWVLYSYEKNHEICGKS